MIKHKDHFHGSDLEKIEEIYGIRKEEIVSFSANVNPLGVSPLLRILTGNTLLSVSVSQNTVIQIMKTLLSEMVQPN